MLLDHSQVCVRDDLAISLGDLKQYALRTARGSLRYAKLQVVFALGRAIRSTWLKIKNPKAPAARAIDGTF